jgi:3-ketosteroid 9alpha-monooxygenase subunit A
VENTPDYHHFVWVHGAGQSAKPLLWQEEGHYLRTRIQFVFGYGKQATWMTPNGAVTGEIETEAWGLGLSNARFVLEDFVTSQLTATTPVDREHSQLFNTMTSRREPGSDDPAPAGLAQRMLEFQKGQIRSDFRIWENQRYVEHPPFAGGKRSTTPGSAAGPASSTWGRTARRRRRRPSRRSPEELRTPNWPEPG